MMGRFSAWWASMPATQRTLIAIGVPAVAVAALVASMRGRKTAAAQDKAKVTPPTGDPQVFDPGPFASQIASAEEGLTGTVAAAAQQISTATNPATQYEATGSYALVGICDGSNGGKALDELVRRARYHDPRALGVNDTVWKLPNGAVRPCWYLYAERLLEEGLAIIPGDLSGFGGH